MSEDPGAGSLRRAQGLDRLAEFCHVGMRRTGAEAMAVMVTETIGGLELVHSTAEVAERTGQLEIALGEGPSLDAAVTALPAGVDDLAGVVPAHRWPLFTTEAVPLGVRSMYAFPIVFARRPIGVLTSYSSRPGRLTSDSLRQLGSLTEIIGLVLLDPSNKSSLGSVLRMSVHQAAGMVMQQTGTSIHDALVLLRSAAFTEDADVTEIAADVIAGRRRFPEARDDG